MSNDNKNICNICYDIIDENNDNLSKLKCGHIYHHDCIVLSYTYSNNTKCPYCRQDGGLIKKLSKLCKAIIKNGKKKGMLCNCKIKNANNNYCGRHTPKIITIE